jgi:hypothetical protein
MYEGRTRGKRMKYTYSEDEDDYTSDAPDVRRSTRGHDISSGPTVTASGRQVRTRFGNLYGSARESPATDGFDRSDRSEEPATANGRSTRSRGALDGWANGESHIAGYNEVDEMDEEDDAVSSGEEWQGEDEMDGKMDDEDEEMSEATDEELEPQSLIVKLQYRKGESTQRSEQQTSIKAKEPDLAFRAAPTPTTSGPINKAQTPQSQENSPMPHTAMDMGANGYSNFQEPSTIRGATGEQPQPTIPSFAKFLYSPPASTESSLQNRSINHQTLSSLPTPPTTSHPPPYPPQYRQD